MKYSNKSKFIILTNGAIFARALGWITLEEFNRRLQIASEFKQKYEDEEDKDV